MDTPVNSTYQTGYIAYYKIGTVLGAFQININQFHPGETTHEVIGGKVRHKEVEATQPASGRAGIQTQVVWLLNHPLGCLFH